MKYYCKIRNGHRVSFSGEYSTENARKVCCVHIDHETSLDELFELAVYSFRKFAFDALHSSFNSHKQYIIWKELFSKGMDIVYEDGRTEQINLHKNISELFRKFYRDKKLVDDSASFLAGLMLLCKNPDYIARLENLPNNDPVIYSKLFAGDGVLVFYENEEDYVIGKLLGTPKKDNSNIISLYQAKLKEFPFAFQEE